MLFFMHVLSGLVEKDPALIKQGAQQYLRWHHGAARRGHLKDTPEGWVALPVIAILRFARARCLLVELDPSPYVPAYALV